MIPVAGAPPAPRHASEAARGDTASGGPAPGGSRPVTPAGREVIKRLRFPLALIALILITGAGVALLQPHSGASYLDPRDAGPFGTHALAQLLTNRGQQLARVSTPQEAADVAAADTTLVVTGTAFFDDSELTALSGLPGDWVLVEPDTAALRILAPGISAVGAVPVAPANPACGMAAARLAGDAEMGGIGLRAAPPVAIGAQQCYPLLDGPSLLRYQTAGRTVTILGTGLPLTNDGLADRGDAALALNLLASRKTVIWLTPGAAALSPAGPGRRTLTSLLPWPVYLIVIQLLVAVAALAIWRTRRLGPLVTEALPAVVRAAETVEGHGRLYRSRHARDRAADALRQGVVGRLAPRIGLPPEPGPAEVTAAVAARSNRDVAAVDAALFGPAPGTDAALVQLANDLDALESEVRQT